MDGARIDRSSSLAVLKTACESLGVSTHGSRLQLFKRLMSHLQQHELLAAHSETQLVQRAAETSEQLQNLQSKKCVNTMPRTSHTRSGELCVAHKGHAASEHSVVSFDFGYADRGTADSLTILFMYDRSTKMMHAVPTPAKGGCMLSLAQELCRFVN